MRTALDLPDDLFREVKIHAVQQGRKFKDVVAELLRRGLDAPQEGSGANPKFERDPVSGLTVVLGQTPIKPDQELNPDQLADVLLSQEVEWLIEAGR